MSYSWVAAGYTGSPHLYSLCQIWHLGGCFFRAAHTKSEWYCGMKAAAALVRLISSSSAPRPQRDRAHAVQNSCREMSGKRLEDFRRTFASSERSFYSIALQYVTYYLLHG